MTGVEDMQELLVHELSDALEAEKAIVLMLPQLREECHDDNIKQALQEHEVETRQQIANLNRCFEVLGRQPERVVCHTMLGLKREHDEFLGQKPTPEMLTIFNMGTGTKTEYYEMAAYRSLMEKANMLDQGQVAELLEQNLRQEEAMAQRLENMSPAIVQDAIA